MKVSQCGNERQEKSDRRKAGRKGSGKNSDYLKPLKGSIERENFRLFFALIMALHKIAKAKLCRMKFHRFQHCFVEIGSNFQLRVF